MCYFLINYVKMKATYMVSLKKKKYYHHSCEIYCGRPAKFGRNNSTVMSYLFIML